MFLSDKLERSSKGCMRYRSQGKANSTEGISSREEDATRQCDRLGGIYIAYWPPMGMPMKEAPVSWVVNWGLTPTWGDKKSGEAQKQRELMIFSGKWREEEEEGQEETNEMSGLGLLDDFVHRVASLLVGRHEVVDALTVGRVDGVDLDQVVLLHDRIGVLEQGRALNEGKEEKRTSPSAARHES
jgi:hypothetical protein